MGGFDRLAQDWSATYIIAGYSRFQSVSTPFISTGLLSGLEAVEVGSLDLAVGRKHFTESYGERML